MSFKLLLHFYSTFVTTHYTSSKCLVLFLLYDRGQIALLLIWSSTFASCLAATILASVETTAILSLYECLYYSVHIICRYHFCFVMLFFDVRLFSHVTTDPNEFVCKFALYYIWTIGVFSPKANNFLYLMPTSFLHVFSIVF